MDKQKIFSREDKEIYRDGDKLIKVFDSEYSKANILNEALNHARVEETNLNMPKIRSIRVVDGKWAIILDYIEGKTLEQVMAEDPDNIESQISATDLDATTRYELHTRLDSMPKHTHLCHGDFNPTNIIITDDGIPYVIDWAHATQGNSSADVARSYLLFCLAGKKQLADKYLKLYCKKSDTALQYIQRWIPIVAASRLVKAPETEKAFLHNWIDVVDYE